MNVKVISCFPAHPRRRRYETEPPTDRKAFSLCVDDADRDRLLDDSKWPDSVVISEWYHINPDDRRKATTATEEVNANEPSDHRLSLITVAATSDRLCGTDTSSSVNPTAQSDASMDASSSGGNETIIYHDGTPTLMTICLLALYRTV